MFSELTEDEYNYIQTENDDEIYTADPDSLDSLQILNLDYDEEVVEHESFPLEDWDADYYLSNNQNVNDILTGTYLKFIKSPNSTDINDILDEENLLSFNNGVYGAEDFDDTLDVRIGYSKRNR
jgi:hypothetical protein